MQKLMFLAKCGTAAVLINLLAAVTHIQPADRTPQQTEQSPLVTALPVGRELIVDADPRGRAAYKDIQSAVDAAPEGAVVRVMPGTYAGPVTVRRPVILVGTGDATLKARGIDALRWRSSGGAVVGLNIRTELGGSIAPFPFGAVDVKAGWLHLERATLWSALGPALHVRDGGRVEGIDVSVFDTHGSAFALYRNGSATLRRAKVERAADATAVVFEGGRLELIDASVSHSGGLFIRSGGVLNLRNSRILHSLQTAVTVTDGAGAQIVGGSIRLGGGLGLVADAGGRIAARDLFIGEMAEAGVFAGGGGRVVARGVRIEDGAGEGVKVASGGMMWLSGAEISGNVGDGARAIGEDASIRISNSRILGNHGSGLDLGRGAKGYVEGGLIERNGGAGIIVGPGAELDTSGAKVGSNAGAALHFSDNSRLEIADQSGPLH